MLLQFKINVFYLNIYSNVIYSCDEKAKFSAASLQCQMILQKSCHFLYLKILILYIIIIKNINYYYYYYIDLIMQYW